ncbi:DUF1345 domain-containing protein [Spirosoma sp. BT702]|uniref:DUF1345 domain-containing protein n=1 Tax=Spirosoma profusum TaxID=2771354 RepID=A0A927AVE6_9BACT|nr:DUF1345 domain-containing protein [Spirosoma profusum]MBD2705119.1 DUF1345 domain-containing protein [Spirosoma profusum]
MLTKVLYRITHLKAQQRLFIGLSAALAAYLVSKPAHFSFPAQLTSSWVAYVITHLSIMWTSILLTHPKDLPRISRIEDSSRSLILLLIVVAAIASLFAVLALLGSTNSHDPMQVEYNVLAILAVAGAWGLVHTVFTFHYAHRYYGNDGRKDRRPGGLDFPNDQEPDYLDFAYFSFVIGMTSQVSDVAIQSKTMRRLALVHGILSFGFNAVIIALTISGLSGITR